MKYIYGLNKSGQSIIKFLNRIKEPYCCWDEDIKIRRKLIRENSSINLVEPDSLNFKLIKESFVTPGVSLSDKKIEKLRYNNISLYRDLELYSRIVKNKKIIAITGTNGKSTTAKLISDLLNRNQVSNFLGGNIGIPLLDFIHNSKKIKYHVIELSSFQLESVDSFNPYISILLNIARDHLDRYDNYSEYVFQKEKIISFNKKGFNIVCIDDPKTKELYKKYKKKIIPISKKYVSGGIYIKNKFIVDDYFKENKKISINSLSSSLFGSFNTENILSAYVVSKILKIDINSFLSLLKKFKGLPHRLEMVYKNDNFQVINNSKATNVHASLQSIYNYQNIYLILGGRAKEKDFKKILFFKNNINKIYLIGEAAELIFKQLSNEIKCEIYTTIEIATKKIFLDIKKNQEFKTILFSPACTSFDQFKNFETRGKFFKKTIKNLIYE